MKTQRLFAWLRFRAWLLLLLPSWVITWVKSKAIKNDYSFGRWIWLWATFRPMDFR